MPKLSKAKQGQLDLELLKACNELDPFWVQENLALGANPNAYAAEAHGHTFPGDFGIHACLRAAMHSRLKLATEAQQCIEALVQAGADIDAPTEDNRRECPLAVFILGLADTSNLIDHHPEAARRLFSTLIDQGATLNNPSSFGQPLNYLWNWHEGRFASGNAIELLSLAIEKGASKTTLEKCLREMGEKYKEFDPTERLNQGICKVALTMVQAGARPQAFGRAALATIPSRHWAAVVSAHELNEMNATIRKPKPRKARSI